MIEVTIATMLCTMLMLMLSTSWMMLNRPTSSLVAWGQLFQEMEIAVATMTQDLGGCASDYRNTSSGLPGGKWEGMLYSCSIEPSGGGAYLRLKFYGDDPTDSNKDWMVDYYLDDEYHLMRVRKLLDETVIGSYYVADNVEGMTVEDDPNDSNNIKITLTFQYPKYTEVAEELPISRTCILITKKSP